MKLSPWNSFFHGTFIVDEDRKMSLKQRVDVAKGLFLDFLYPAGALRFPRQRSSRRSDRQKNQRLYTRLSGLGQRFYVSLADEPDRIAAEMGCEIHESDAISSIQARPTKILRDPHTSLEGLFNSESKNDYEEAWRLYELCNGKQRQQSLSQLLAYLSTSHHFLNAERCAHLFQSICEIAGPDDFRIAIQAYLRLGDVSQAMYLHQKSLEKHKIQSGSDILLAQVVESSQWLPAFIIWSNFDVYGASPSYSIWDSVVRLPNILEKVLELDAFVDSELEKLEITPASRILEFASTMVECVIFEKARKERGNSIELTEYVTILKRWMSDLPSRYEGFIQELILRGNDRLAISFYRQYRRNIQGQISSDLLQKLLKLFCQHHALFGIKQVLNDFFRYHGGLSRSAYTMCINEFARQGNVNVVKTLFSEYWGQIKSTAGQNPNHRPMDIVPLLHVHAKRGELAEVIKIFHNIEKDFGIKPDTCCWNVLINAYGKIHDVSGAFDAFQKMQQSSVRPNTFTFGTLMGIATTRGDFKTTLELYNLAKSQGVYISTAIVDCLVLGYIQHDRLLQAERVCEDALKMDLKTPRTRMWNCLLTAYALRRDLDSVDRLLYRMRINGVQYDAFTYSALMKSLTAAHQPDRAYSILKKEMPRVGVKVTSVHYAIVMAGFIETGQLEKVLQVQNRMLSRYIKQSTSTRLLVLKARVKATLLSPDPQDVKLEKVERYMQETYSMSTAEDAVEPVRTGIGRPSPDIAHYVYFDFLMSTYAKLNAFDRVQKLYQQYCETVPKNRLGELPLGILVSLMASCVEEGDYDAVQKCWELAFQQARKHGRPLGASKDGPVLHMHRYSLSDAISVQIASLSHQGRLNEVGRTINEIMAAGFLLGQKNWNVYVQILTKNRKYSQAFELCESILMPNWTGWARVRWTGPVRNRLPMDLRLLKKRKDFLRPQFYTLLHLAKAYNDLRNSEAESHNTKLLLARLKRECPKTFHAIQTMRKADDLMERSILGGQEQIQVRYL